MALPLRGALEAPGAAAPPGCSPRRAGLNGAVISRRSRVTTRRRSTKCLAKTGRRFSATAWSPLMALRSRRKPWIVSDAPGWSGWPAMSGRRSTSTASPGISFADRASSPDANARPASQPAGFASFSFAASRTQGRIHTSRARRDWFDPLRCKQTSNGACAAAIETSGSRTHTPPSLTLTSAVWARADSDVDGKQ